MQIGRGTGPRVVVATRASLDQAAAGRDTLQSALTQLRRGVSAQMEDLLNRLVTAGYERVAQISTRGQFAVRGGIVDVYSWQAPLPLRLEFFGDEIESLREFDIDTQTSVRDVRSVDILLNQGAADQGGFVRDYVRTVDPIIDVKPVMEGAIPATPGSRDLALPHIQVSEGWIEIGPEDFSGAFQDCDIGEFGAG